MPAGPGNYAYPDGNLNYYHGNHKPANGNVTGGDESAASILQSVKEQEAQFELLTRELEAERQSVANQLERCKLGSETASMSSISSTDESFHWRAPQIQESMLEVESDTDSKVSGSQLVDSCLRVLQERGLMNVGDVQLSHMDESLGSPPRPPPSSEHYQPYSSVTALNGPSSMYDRNNTNSPNLSIQSGNSNARTQRTVTTVTKVTSTRQVQQVAGGGDYAPSPHPSDNYSNYSNYASLTQLHNQGPPTPQRGTPTFRPMDGGGDAPTPTRFQSHNNYEPYNSFQPVPAGDSFDQPSPRSNRDIYGDPYDDDSLRLNGGQSYPAHYSDRHNDNPSVEDDRYRSNNDPYQDHRPDNRYADAAPAEDRFNNLLEIRKDLPSADRQDPYRTASPATGDRYNNPLYEHAAPTRTAHGNDYSDYPPPPPEVAKFSNPSYHQPPTNEDSYRSLQPDDRYGSDPENRYGNGPDERYGNGPSDRYGNLQPDDRYGADDRYGTAPDDRYGGIGPDERYGGPAGDDRYMKTPSPAPGSDRYAAPGYNDRSPYDSMSRPYDPYGSRQMYPDEQNREPQRVYDDEIPRSEAPHVGAPPDFSQLDGMRRSPSIDSQTRDARWRNPDLPEVIEYLSHPSNSTKANAAAYLQHLCYMDDGVKAKTRSLGGIPVLVDLLKADIPEVHRNACGALRNLSYGRANDDNKKAIRNAGGIPDLIRLLRKSPDNDVREIVTGILWNLSSSQDLKKPIIDDGLTVLVNNVIIPHSGWNGSQDDDRRPKDVYWSMVFRNASGVLRNVSSDGEYARKKIRECEGLVDSILHIVSAAIGKNDIDNKSVENCVCLLRNLSYACQEVEDNNYVKRRQMPKQQAKPGEENPGCFGGGKKKKDFQKVDQRNRSDSGYQSGRVFDSTRPRTEPPSGQDLLWLPSVVHIYLPLLSDCSNPETLEAAAGAIQNLAACEWEPSVAIRATVRKEKGLPIIVELLTIEADRVVCAAATALRNLAVDTRNRELIGKYAMRQLVMKLPSDDHKEPPEKLPSDNTITAVLATLYEVIKKNSDFAQSLLNEGGVGRLVHLTRSRGQYSPKVVKFASTVLYSMWQFKELHAEYKKQGFKEQHFITRTMAARAQGSRSPPMSANNTLHRPRMDQSGPVMAGYNESTLPPISRLPNNHQPNQMGYLDEKDPSLRADQGYGGGFGTYDDRRGIDQEDIALHEMSNMQGYASIDSRTGRDQEDYRPPGGMAMYPNPPQQQYRNISEPLYAQVDKRNKMHSEDNMQNPRIRLENPPPEGAGADSWV